MLPDYPTRRASGIRRAIAILAVAAVPASAQTPEIPERPRLGEGVDSNSALAYYQHGEQQIKTNPREAADAFYWASRLAPPWANPYYARAVALVLSDRNRLVRYVTGDKSVRRSARALSIDSLRFEAYLRNPLIVSPLDYHVFAEFMSQVTDGQSIGRGRFRSGDPASDAWVAYMQGNYIRAISHYAAAIKRDPKDLELHETRARAFSALAKYDSAVVELNRLLEKMREHEKERLENSFQSIAFFEFSLAQLHTQRGDDAQARAAFERAVTTDLSFYAAHAALGDLAMQRGDTVVAVGEYRQAVDLRPADGGLRAAYALALLQASSPAEAVKQLKAAIELEPYFAQPYFVLARVFDNSGFQEEALSNYEQFLARSALTRTERTWVQTRVTELRQPAP